MQEHLVSQSQRCVGKVLFVAMHPPARFSKHIPVSQLSSLSIRLTTLDIQITLTVHKVVNILLKFQWLER